MKKGFLYFLCCICSATIADAQSILSKQKIMIGDTLTFISAQEKPPTYFPGSIFIANGTKGQYTLQPFQYGTYTFTDSACIKDTFEIKSLAANQLFVDTPQVDFKKDIRPIYTVKVAKDYTKIIIGSILILLLLAGLIYLLMRLQKKKTENIYTATLKELQDVTAKSNGLEAAEKIQALLKKYIQERLHIQLLAGTNTQTLVLMKHHPLIVAQYDQLAKMFNDIEQAKFAKYPTGDIKNIQELAIQIVTALESNKVRADIAAQNAVREARKNNSR